MEKIIYRVHSSEILELYSSKIMVLGVKKLKRFKARI